MNKKDKLLKRLCSSPKDFTYDELVTVFKSSGFEINNKGATSGSRVEFYNEEKDLSYIMHKPHPSNIIKGYVMKQVVNYLKMHNIIKD